MRVSGYASHKQLKLSTMLAEHPKLGRQAAVQQHSLERLLVALEQIDLLIVDELG